MCRKGHALEPQGSTGQPTQTQSKIMTIIMIHITTEEINTEDHDPIEEIADQTIIGKTSPDHATEVEIVKDITTTEVKVMIPIEGEREQGNALIPETNMETSWNAIYAVQLTILPDHVPKTTTIQRLKKSHCFRRAQLKITQRIR